MVSRGCPAGRCGISSAPVAALTMGGTTGISQPPNAASGAARSRVNIRYGTARLLARPPSVPSGHSTASMTQRGVRADQGRAEQQRPGPDGQQGHRRRAVELHHDRVAGVAQRGLPVPGPVDDLGHGQHHQPPGGQHPDDRGERAQPGPLHREGGRRGGHDAGAHHRGEPVRPQAGERSAGRSRSRSGPRRARPGRPGRCGPGGVLVLMTPASGRAGRPVAGSSLPTHKQHSSCLAATSPGRRVWPRLVIVGGAAEPACPRSGRPGAVRRGGPVRQHRGGGAAHRDQPAGRVGPAPGDGSAGRRGPAGPRPARVPADPGRACWWTGPPRCSPWPASSTPASPACAGPGTPSSGSRPA